MTWSFQCYVCSKFMSQFDLNLGYSWVPYGHAYDFDPPDAEYSHKKCYDNLNESHRNLIFKTSWIKPCTKTQMEVEE